MLLNIKRECQKIIGLDPRSKQILLGVRDKRQVNQETIWRTGRFLKFCQPGWHFLMLFINFFDYFPHAQCPRCVMDLSARKQWAVTLNVQMTWIAIISPLNTAHSSRTSVVKLFFRLYQFFVVLLRLIHIPVVSKYSLILPWI